MDKKTLIKGIIIGFIIGILTYSCTDSALYGDDDIFEYEPLGSQFNPMYVKIID